MSVRIEPSETAGISFYLIREGKPAKPIPLRDAYFTLKDLAVSGNLYFQGTKLFADFFSEVKLAFEVKKSSPGVWELDCFAHMNGKEIPLESVEVLGQGPPHWFILRPLLKFINDAVAWKWLKQFKDKSLSLNTSEKDAFLKENHLLCRRVDTELRVPVLVVDKSGGFANLLLEDAEGKRSPCQAATKEESIWEADLEASGYQKKSVGATDFYCPLDKVKNSIRFLLECGWSIEDQNGRSVFLPGKPDFHLIEDNQDLHLKGSIPYGAFSATIGGAAASMRCNEVMISLGPDAAGLLPDVTFPEEAAVTSDGILVQRNQFGLLKEWGEPSGHPLFAPIQPAPSPTTRFQGSLRPYQQLGVDWMCSLWEKGFHGLLADEMGLGKTVQVLAFLARVPFALIVMPATLLFNWKQESLRFLPDMPITLHHGADRKEKLPESGLVLTSYGTLKQDLPLFSSVMFPAIVLDEAQGIKNPQSLAAQAVCQLKGKFRLSMTGTPVENARKDLWSQFNFLMPGLLGNEAAFCQADARLIQMKISPFVLRRRKEEVARELPEKIEQIAWVEMDPRQMALYRKFSQDAKQGILQKIRVDGMKSHRMEILEILLRLRQICCHPQLLGYLEPSAKLDVLFEDLHALVEEGRKAIVFSQFTSMLALIKSEAEKRGWPVLLLDGKTKDREKVVASFCKDPERQLLFMSLKAGGVGLNLSVADVVFLYDPWWNDAVEAQAIARAHRIGRTFSVLAKRMIAAGTIEEKMIQLKQEKKNLSDSIFENEMSFHEEDLAFLLD